MKSNNLKEQIVNDYSKFVKFVIKDMNLGHKFDEIYDVGIIGFVNGINTYDESKGIMYSTYLYECIKNEILHYLKYEKQIKRDGEVISLNMDVGNNTELLDMIPSYENYEGRIYMDELLYVINRRLSFLNERDEEIFKHLYGLDGYKQLNSIELEKKYHTTRQNIQRIKAKTLRILKYATRNYYSTFQDIMKSKNKAL